MNVRENDGEITWLPSPRTLWITKIRLSGIFADHRILNSGFANFGEISVHQLWSKQFFADQAEFSWFDDLQGSAEVEMMMIMKELATLMIQLHFHWIQHQKFTQGRFAYRMGGSIRLRLRV